MNPVPVVTPSGWVISARVDGEVLVARASEGPLTLMLVTGPAGYAPADLEGWLAELIGVATESRAPETKAGPLPALLHRALTGLLFSHAELWERSPAHQPCSVVCEAGPVAPAFGWVGDAEVAVWMDDGPVSPAWVRVRDSGGREARALTLDPLRSMRVVLEWSSTAEDGVLRRAEITADWVPSPPPAATDAERERTAASAAPGEAGLAARAEAGALASPAGALPEAEAEAEREHPAWRFRSWVNLLGLGTEASSRVTDPGEPRGNAPHTEDTGEAHEREATAEDAALSWIRPRPESVGASDEPGAGYALVDPLSLEPPGLEELVPPTPEPESLTERTAPIEAHAAAADVLSDVEPATDPALVAGAPAPIAPPSAAAPASDDLTPPTAAEPSPAGEAGTDSSVETAAIPLVEDLAGAAPRTPDAPEESALPGPIVEPHLAAGVGTGTPMFPDPEAAPAMATPGGEPPVASAAEPSPSPAVEPASAAEPSPSPAVERASAAEPSPSPAVEPASVAEPSPSPAAPHEAGGFLAPEPAPGRARPAPPRRPRQEWPEEPERRTPWKQIALVAAAIAILFAVGWAVGSLGGRERGLGSSLQRAMDAIGLGPGSFTLIADSQPPGAWVSVDGRDLGVHTPASIELRPGEHEVTLTLQGLGSAAYPVRGARGQRVPVGGTLWGSLTVTSADPGVPVSVSVDAVPRGQVPVTVDPLEPGIHRIEFVAPGIGAWDQTAEVRIHESTQIVAHPLATAPTGILQVQATVPGEAGPEPLNGARVWIDGEPRGVTPLRLELARGPHSVRVSRGSEDPGVQLIDLPGGNTRYASFDLGGELPPPRVAVAPLPERIPLDRPTVVSASLPGVPGGDVREMWLHVSTPENAWRRYAMNLMRSPSGTVGAVVFPLNAFDARGRARWYVSVLVAAGDEYFTEITTSASTR